MEYSISNYINTCACFTLLLSFDCHTTKNEPRNAVNSAFLGSCTLFKLGFVIVILKHIYLSFMTFQPIFYLCYIYYSGSLILCCQYVATSL